MMATLLFYRSFQETEIDLCPAPSHDASLTAIR